jgi:hypothetical protein
MCDEGQQHQRDRPSPTRTAEAMMTAIGDYPNSSMGVAGQAHGAASTLAFYPLRL